MLAKIGRVAALTGPLVAIVGLSACGGEGMDGTGGTEAAVDAQSSALTVVHRLGNKRDSSSTLSAHRLASLPSAGTLPASIDLSASLPAPGNQGAIGSCVAWATGYATKSYQEGVEMNWSLASDAHQFSASWIYNQLNGGTDNGLYIGSALDLIVSKGADTLSNFPYVATLDSTGKALPSDYTTQPDANSMARASHFKAKSWNSLTVSELNIKNVLATRTPVIVGINVMPDMDNLNSTNSVYDTTAGTYAAPYPVCTVAPCIRGRHAVTLIGYDDSRKAFKFINSWATGWGLGGYGWIAYSFVTNATLAMDAYVLTDAPNTGAMGYGICGVGEPGCERAPTTLHRSTLTCSGSLISTDAPISLATYSNYTCENRYRAQCIDDGTPDAFYMENCDYGSPTCIAKGSKHYGCDPGAKPAGTCRPTVLHRKRYACDGTLQAPESTTDLTTGYSNYTCGNRFSEQCVNDGSFDSYYSEWCEYTCQ